MYVRTPWSTPGRPLQSVALCFSVFIPEMIQHISTKIFFLLLSRTFPARLDTNKSNSFILDEFIKGSNGIATTTNTGNDRVRQLALCGLKLLLDLPTDHLLEIAHHGREGMRPYGGANEVVRRRQVCHPVAHSFVDCIL